MNRQIKKQGLTTAEQDRFYYALIKQAMEREQAEDLLREFEGARRLLREEAGVPERSTLDFMYGAAFLGFTFGFETAAKIAGHDLAAVSPSEGEDKN
jgi:hypothetical protein